MFTPFIQYTIDNQDLTKPPVLRQKEKTNADQQQELKQNVLDIVEVGGCLEQSSTRRWTLTNASDPIASKIQATSSVALKAAQAKPLGSGRYQLLGVSVFNPSSHNRQRVAVKGVLIKDTKESRLNVTSLQTVAARCF